jgi:hypothetical protein
MKKIHFEGRTDSTEKQKGSQSPNLDEDAHDKSVLLRGNFKK